MSVIEAGERTDALLDQLEEVWLSSVRATHHFLSPADIRSLRPEVRRGLASVPRLFLMMRDNAPAAFMGVDGASLEMCFVAAAHRGRGLGTRLLRHAVDQCGVTRVDVNEQNPLALAFYQSRGFAIASRSETDSQGRPWPILHLRLS